MKNLKALFALLAALALILAAGCSDGSDGNSTTKSDYDILADGTWVAYTEDGLLAWAAAAQKDLSTSCNLGADITLASDWTPVGDSDNPYSGTFDGKGYTISGLKIDSSDMTLGGLFGFVGEEGVVRNLNLTNVDVALSKASSSVGAGGIAGYNYGIISDCAMSGNVTSGSYSRVGGIVGYNYGKITGCTSSVEISTETYGGGIAGQNQGTIIGCSSSGTVSSTSSHVGGIAGCNSTNGEITACYFIGSVSSTANNYAGGIAGENYSTSKITGCYYYGGTVSVVYRFAGGIVGKNGSSATVDACYWSGTVTVSGSSTDAGVGNSSGTITNVEKVDGKTITRTSAESAMNSAIADSGWQYVTGSSGREPLVLKKS